ncbi:MAG: DUF362 domain-containing protein [Proteobacteria bacterium]|nr:DUF362 domain-containing protein [Pseudomonadota bacterium]
MDRPKVSIFECLHYDPAQVADSLSRLLTSLGGMSRYVREGERVLLKPNLLKASPPDKAVTTHPVIIEAVVREVQKAGGIPLIGDSPGIGSMKKIFDVTGMSDVAERTGARLVEFNESVEVKTAEGSTFKSLELSKDVIEADKVINLPKVKTHAQMYVTLGVKNCFGCVVGKRKPQWHFKAGVTREYFANLLLDIYNAVQPTLTIADGITAMEGNGPGGGDPRDVGLLFASSNALAMDRVITDVLGLRERDVPLFHAARKRGYAGVDIEDIDVMGADISDMRMKGFKPPKIIDMMFGPPFLRRYFKKALTARPDINHDECTLCMDCVKTCPTDVMSAKEGKIDIFYRDCIHCFCCQEICPHGAIVPKQGWLLKMIGGKS